MWMCLFLAIWLILQTALNNNENKFTNIVLYLNIYAQSIKYGALEFMFICIYMDVHVLQPNKLRYCLNIVLAKFVSLIYRRPSNCWYMQNMRSLNICLLFINLEKWRCCYFTTRIIMVQSSSHSLIIRLALSIWNNESKKKTRRK